MDPKCEVMLTIMSSLAQEESRSISENVRWGKRRSMEAGNVHLAYSRFLGYRKGADGRPEIVEEEAAIVQDIYAMYLDGRSIQCIADTLTKRKIPTPAGKDRWSFSTVRSILSNEKYKGEALLQKTYTVDYLTKEVRKNNGEVMSVRVRKSHEAIIDPDVFDHVQELLKARKKRKAAVQSHHPFAGRIICADCGGYYGHKVWRLRSTSEHYDVWYCNHKYDGDSICKSHRLRETEIITLFELMQQKRGVEDTSYSEDRWLETVEELVVYTDKVIFTLTDGSTQTLSLPA